MQNGFEFEQPLTLFLRQLFDRNLCPVCHDLCDLVLRHHQRLFLLIFLVFAHCLVIFLDQLILRLAQFCRLRVGFHSDRPLNLKVKFFDLRCHLLKAVWHIHILEPDCRRCLVYEINRLVWKISVIDIAV